jgi:apolipoprotein N-acyltransferase
VTRRLDVAIVATILSGVLYALAFPPLRLRPLAWVALVPLLLVLRHARWPRRLGLGVLWTLASGWSVGTWMPTAVATYFDQPLGIGVALFLIVTLCMAAPYYTAFALAYGPLARLGAAAPLLAAAAWAAAELARGRLLNGALTYVGNSPWATLGYSQAGFPAVLQIASLTGVYGVSFLVAAVNAGLAEVIDHARARGRVTPNAWRGLATALGCAVAALVGGEIVLHGAAPPASPVPVAIVQANLGAAVRWSAEGPARTLETYARLTRESLGDDRPSIGDDRPSIVFWPEAAITAFLEQEDGHRRALAALVGDRTELLVGAPRAGTPDGGAPFTNSVYLVGAGGEITARYDKQFLLPFMEYFPLRLDMARRQFGRVREFTPGGPTPPLPTRAGAAGMLVCNEAFLPHVAGARVADGATYLVNPSNDSWVPDAGFAAQQFDLAALRAVEQRRWLLRVSDSGPSGVVDPYGRVVATTPPLARAVLRSTVEPITGRTVYGRIGDAFGTGCALVTLAALVRGRRRRPERPSALARDIRTRSRT